MFTGLEKTENQFRTMSRDEAIKLFQSYSFVDSEGNLLTNCGDFLDLIEFALPVTLSIDKDLPTTQKSWWFEPSVGVSISEQMRALLSEFFGVDKGKRPVEIYMSRDGLGQALGERMFLKGLPISFVKDRDSIAF
jgi:hypothetical protein